MLQQLSLHSLFFYLLILYMEHHETLENDIQYPFTYNLNSIQLTPVLIRLESSTLSHFKAKKKTVQTDLGYKFLSIIGF